MTKEEYNARFRTFKSNLELIKAHEDGQDGYSLGLNKFADMTKEEYQSMLGLKGILDGESKNDQEESKELLPEEQE